MMATGYVHPVADGEVTELRDFALRCARAMGACIMMRDEPMDALPPRRFEPQLDYHNKRLTEAQSRLDLLATMTPEQRAEKAETEWAERLASASKADEESLVEYQRVRAMLAKVEAWEGGPEGLKDFMLQQLRMCTEHEPYLMVAYLGDKPTADQWHEKAFKDAVADVGRAQENIAREIALTAGRNAWLERLWASLPEVAS